MKRRHFRRLLRLTDFGRLQPFTRGSNRPEADGHPVNKSVSLSGSLFHPPGFVMGLGYSGSVPCGRSARYAGVEAADGGVQGGKRRGGCGLMRISFYA